MSIRQGKKLIASSTTNGFSLFDCKWADHILNNISWLRADTFSWQSGDVYKAAYEHLVADYENAEIETLYAWDNGVGYYFYTLSETPNVGDSVYDSSGVLDGSYFVTEVADGGIYIGEDEKTSLLYTRDSSSDTKISQTDTIGSITITYCLADDGHKICLPDQEANLSSLYESTGVAWYYVLDAENKQFKLPRTKFGFTGIRNGVGGYVEDGLPNIEGYFGPVDDSTFVGGKSGAFYKGSSVSYDATSSGSGSGGRIAFDASLSDATYGRAETVQPRATEMYLYFYVGNYVENATTVDVGKLTEIVNDFDIDAFKPEVDEAKNSAIVDISDAKTDAIDSLTNLATDLGTSLKYGNVGDIFYTSRLDVSLNGAVECNGNLYSTTDFSGAQSIGNLLRDSKVPYISLSEHQTTVDTYGSCRCFGWDGGTEFRVPKLTDVFIEAGVATSEGEFITAGLPNITGGTGGCVSNATPYGVFALGGQYGTAGGGAGKFYQNTFDASRSSSVYGNSTTVQPPAVRYRAMVQLAFGATDDAVVAAGSVVADVAELNMHRVIEFQVPTSANNYTWYRKYADGWVEQGGRATTNSGNPCQVTLPVEMADVYYNINILGQTTTDGYSNAAWQVMSVSTEATPKTTTKFYGQPSITGYNLFFYWEVKGMAA